MEDSLDDYLEGVILSDKAILERVDEYALYSYYLGFEPELGVKFNSPIREENNLDSNSSFSIFPPSSKKAQNEYLWKDSGNGKVGNIFGLVGILHSTKNVETVYKIIDRDFKLGFSNNSPIDYQIKPVRKPPPFVKAEIRVRSREFLKRDLEYWKTFGISKETLDYYNVTSVDCYWLRKEQTHPKSHGDPCFAYRIWSKYKIYRPLAPDRSDKFRNNYTENHIEGFCQLQYKSDTVIITKSLKDVMLFYELGYEAIASHSESNILPEKVLKYLESKYKRILVWYDNDGKTQADKYPYPKLYVPIESGEKDPSDYYKRYGKEATAELIKQQIDGCKSSSQEARGD